MQLRHILVPTDQSDTSRNALRVALALAARAGARVSVMTTVGGQAGWGDADDPAVLAERLKHWVEPELQRGAPAPTVSVTFGIPGVEICRFADEHEVDLIVIGRKHRSQATRLLVGDTADAVARRSRVPCLFVPLGAGAPERLLVALDGSRRSLTVLRAACDFSSATGISFRATTVEPAHPDEPAQLAALVPSGRSDALREAVEQLALCGSAHGGTGLDVRRGPVVDSLLTAADELAADAIAVGYHRGGPPGVLEAGSIARRLAHSAECAVLTIPF